MHRLRGRIQTSAFSLLWFYISATHRSNVCHGLLFHFYLCKILIEVGISRKGREKRISPFIINAVSHKYGLFFVMDARTSPTLKLWIIRFMMIYMIRSLFSGKSIDWLFVQSASKKNEKTQRSVRFWHKSHTRLNKDNILMFRKVQTHLSATFQSWSVRSVMERLVHHFINSDKVSCSSDTLSLTQYYMKLPRVHQLE